MTFHVASLLARSLDEHLPATQQDMVDRHLRDCPECRSLLSDMRATEALLRRSGPAAPLRPFASVTAARRGQRSVVAKALAGGLVAALTVIVALAIGGSIAALRQGSSSPVAAASASPTNKPSNSSRPSSASPGAGPCALPASHPTYLPFSAPGPVEYTYAGGHGVRYETKDSKSGLPLYFSLERATRAAPWAGQGRRVTAGSRTVELMWIGDPGVGAVAARWLEGSGCVEHIGSLVIRTGTREEIEAELIRVIASLTP
jgi:hypothetical protein